MIEKLKEKLGGEVERLQHELNVTLPQEFAGRGDGRPSRENSEYKAALERQQLVRARLGQLRERLSKLSQIDVSQIPSDKVGLGSHVVVQDKKLAGERETYSLVFGDSVEFEEGHVSMSSPIGKSLVGRSVGETVVLELFPLQRAGSKSSSSRLPRRGLTAASRASARSAGPGFPSLFSRLEISKQHLGLPDLSQFSFTSASTTLETSEVTTEQTQGSASTAEANGQARPTIR